MPACRHHPVRWLLAAYVVCTTTGCGLFRSQSASEAVATDKIERAQFATVAPVKPGKHVLRVSSFVFYSDVPLDPKHHLFCELETLPEQIQNELKLPSSGTPIQVFLFEDQQRYQAYIRSRDPKLPERPAFFFAEQRGSGLSDDLAVFTYLGDRLQIDLRHELTHALLHSVLKQVPLWLDEGLASYFELPPVANGVNIQHLAAVSSPGFQPNLARLEKLDAVVQMEKREYQEAWAWVHFMLRGRPSAKSALLEYLQSLRSTNNPAPLFQRLRADIADPHAALTEHISRMNPSELTTRTSASVSR